MSAILLDRTKRKVESVQREVEGGGREVGERWEKIKTRP
jgi:hypothetical protein